MTDNPPTYPIAFTQDQMEKLGDLAVAARAVVLADATRDLNPRHVKELEKALTAVEEMIPAIPLW